MSEVKIKWYGEKAKTTAEVAGKQALLTCASDLQGKSARQAPVKKGDLRANCSTTPIEQKSNGFFTSVGYNLPYAKAQHEHLEYVHPRGGKAKFLEDPFNENKSKYDRDIKNAINKALKGR